MTVLMCASVWCVPVCMVCTCVYGVYLSVMVSPVCGVCLCMVCACVWCVPVCV